MRGWEGHDVITKLTLVEGEEDVYKQAEDAINTYLSLRETENMICAICFINSICYKSQMLHRKETWERVRSRSTSTRGKTDQRESWWFEAGRFSELYQFKTYLLVKTLTLPTGELLHIPYIIRCIAPAIIVKQKSKLCQEDKVDPIG